MPYFTIWMLDFFNTIRVSNSLDLDQARHFVRPDLGPNCLQRLTADIAGKESNTKQLDTFWLKPWLKVISFGFNFLCPQRNFGRHIVIALSVRPSVCPSRFRVRSISPIFFEVGIPNLVCGYILGWGSVAYHFGSL